MTVIATTPTGRRIEVRVSGSRDLTERIPRDDAEFPAYTPDPDFSDETETAVQIGGAYVQRNKVRSVHGRVTRRGFKYGFCVIDVATGETVAEAEPTLTTPTKAWFAMERAAAEAQHIGPAPEQIDPTGSRMFFDHRTDPKLPDVVALAMAGVELSHKDAMLGYNAAACELSSAQFCEDEARTLKAKETLLYWEALVNKSREAK